ncbi:protein kinase [Demequina sp. SYSU T00039]|uniref:non-specific serine/threonine protein kinase n=1 Tax=Demequina lignilytica TaxID=3051663 RepID=A0AAW7M7K7_9MICO|nr:MULTISPECIES: serine/threonine-protein kinase [unclassified Demequina]MDN4477774.1 protein kinase [Demequina sp. SYSU T00039-1]MDN4487683.1 protein kinase [Demequina sp. SYSU T00039]MDN4491394.1 protein kinase [Demequina sp. SYSU T00068]
MAIHAGTTLGGRYVLRSMIAVGGMGEVWRGTDADLDRDVAVKVLKDGAAENETFLKRFRNEAKNAAGLIHANIAQVYDFGEHAGTPYLVMEMVEGEPLSTMLERERTLDEARLVVILRHTCRGLAVAHEAGVMHRDIKPGNLLVQEGDHVKITDFGVSRGTDQTTLTATGMVMGTAQYLAPELALGKPATPQSDLYAMGIIAFEAVAGKRPFTAASAVDIAIAQVNEPVPALPAGVSPQLADLILRLLEKNPRKRPATALELDRLLADLDLAPGERAAPATPASSPTPTTAPRRAMPPSIAPREFRPRPDVSRRRPAR